MPASDWFSLSFERMADSLAGRLGGPVFLVGSALTLDSPTDYDIRMPLLEHDVERLFGSAKDDDIIKTSRQRFRMLREQLKQSRRLSRIWRVNIDFQFQGFYAFWRHDSPKLRLDKAPKWFFLAGLTDA